MVILGVIPANSMFAVVSGRGVEVMEFSEFGTYIVPGHDGHKYL